MNRSFTGTLNSADLRNINRTIVFNKLFLKLFINIVLGLYASFSLYIYYTRGDVDLLRNATIGLILIGLGNGVEYFFRYYVLKPNSNQCEEHTVEFNENGILLNRDDATFFEPWSERIELILSDSGVFVFNKPGNLFFHLPLRLFKDKLDMESFCNQITNQNEN